jgi:hypothetical protein
MGNILGKDKPLKEVLRENKRMINRAIRELDREKVGLEREEKRLTMEIKKAAKENQMNSVKIMAKVRVVPVLLCHHRQPHGRGAQLCFIAYASWFASYVAYAMRRRRTWSGRGSTLPSSLRCGRTCRDAP